MTARHALLHLVLILPALTPVGSAGQSLRGSRASLEIQNQIAREHDFSYLHTSVQVQRFVSSGYLVPVHENAQLELHQVSFPSARPEVRLFVERLSAQYHAACGERLVVTSLTRPATHQPRNASDDSVHPTGMAVDLRLSRSAACRGWLERVLLDLERARLLEATRERRPAHYHIAVFPRPYAHYVASMGGEAATGERTVAALTRYQVRSGDTLWEIARTHGTTVAKLRATNALSTTRILPGQVLEVPLVASKGGEAATGERTAVALTHYQVRSGDTLWGIARTHGTTVAKLRATNALSTTRILPGQVLEVPIAQ